MKTFKNPSDKQPRNACLEPTREMGFGSDLKSSSKQHQNPRTLKETTLLTHAKQRLKSEDKLKAKHCTSQPFGELLREPRQLKSYGNLGQAKTSEKHRQQSVKVKATKDDELVKYMSNLPVYLQQRGENIQDKVLNVGVLDWTLLENWKCSQKYNPASDGSMASLTSCDLSTKRTMRSSTISSMLRNERLTHQSKHPSHFSSLKSSYGDGISHDKPPNQNFVSETASESSLDGRKRASWINKSSGRNNPDVSLGKGGRKHVDQRITSKVGNLASNPRYAEIPIKPRENVRHCDGEVNKRVEEMQESDIKRKANTWKSTSNVGASSSSLRIYDVLEENNLSNSEVKKKQRELQESVVDLSAQRQPGKRNNIVLLLPKKSSRTSFSSDPMTTSGDHNSTSNSFSHEKVHSSELHADVRPLCSLHSRGETNTELFKMPHNAINNHYMSSDESQRSAHKTCVMPFASKCVEKSGVKVKIDNVKSSMTLDQETAEPEATKGRHSSENSRFSFSFGRLSRSFSFKESSAVPQLSSSSVSMKSGPVISIASHDQENSNKEKPRGHNRTRSSPFRRLLDPLLGSKGSTSLPSTETDQPLKGSFNSFSLEPITIESFKIKRHETSSVQALLQLTVKSGVPLFRFVVNNSRGSGILAATMKNSTSSGKNDSGCNCTFYVIEEIKKRSGSWINQGSREKSCGCVYNVVGQMKINSTSFLDSTTQNSINQYTVKESVLYGVELREADQASPRFMPSRELAAAVVKLLSKNLNFDKQQKDRDQNLMGEDFSMDFSHGAHFSNFGENEPTNSATIILPGGIHGLPIKGAPSPLIQRWKSGGLCDCGGWDVGCKLHILSNENPKSSFRRTSKACLASDCFELFMQGEAEQDKPIFSLAPIEKGMYSIEFSPSISSLQALFICVTVIGCQKSSDMVELGNLFEENIFQTTSTAIPREPTMKFAPSPPFSPVERV